MTVPSPASISNMLLEDGDLNLGERRELEKGFFLKKKEERLAVNFSLMLDISLDTFCVIIG